MNARFWKLATSLVAVCSMMAGCEDNGDKGSGNFKSESFSPISASTEKGETGTLRWVYRINGGEPITASVDGQTVRMSFADLPLTIDPSNLKRQGELTATIASPISGNIGTVFEEALVADSSRTLVVSQHIALNGNLDQDGEKAEFALTIDAVPSHALEWFLDRKDLDGLPIGYTLSDRNVRATVAFSGSISISGMGTQPIHGSSPAQYDEVWTVMSKLASMTVNGKEYANVVQVNRQTMVPNIGLTTSSPQVQTITYWVAKGVGMIKGTGQFTMLGQPLQVELIETNLAP